MPGRINYNTKTPDKEVPGQNVIKKQLLKHYNAVFQDLNPLLLPVEDKIIITHCVDYKQADGKYGIFAIIGLLSIDTKK